MPLCASGVVPQLAAACRRQPGARQGEHREEQDTPPRGTSGFGARAGAFTLEGGPGWLQALLDASWLLALRACFRAPGPRRVLRWPDAPRGRRGRGRDVERVVRRRPRQLGRSGSGGGSSSGVDIDGGVSFDAGCPSGSLGPVENIYKCASDVAGRWAACDGSSAESIHRFGNGPADTVGLEFGPATTSGGGCSATSLPCVGGNLYFLVQDPTGLVRGQGPDYQASYACSEVFFWLSSSGSRSNAVGLYAPQSTDPDLLAITWTGCDLTVMGRIP
jgi:hypothetical protein